MDIATVPRQSKKLHSFQQHVNYIQKIETKTAHPLPLPLPLLDAQLPEDEHATSWFAHPDPHKPLVLHPKWRKNYGLMADFRKRKQIRLLQAKHKEIHATPTELDIPSFDSVVHAKNPVTTMVPSLSTTQQGLPKSPHVSSSSDVSFLFGSKIKHARVDTFPTFFMEF